MTCCSLLGGFSIYLANFADYGDTYGSLGAAVGLHFYFYLCASVVLVGAEVNATIYLLISGGYSPGLIMRLRRPWTQAIVMPRAVARCPEGGGEAVGSSRQSILTRTTTSNVAFGRKSPRGNVSVGEDSLPC